LDLGAGERERGQHGVRRALELVGEIRGAAARGLDVAGVQFAAQLLILRRCSQALALLVIHPEAGAEYQRQTDHKAGDHRSAILLPPAIEFFELFFVGLHHHSPVFDSLPGRPAARRNATSSPRDTVACGRSSRRNLTLTTSCAASSSPSTSAT